MSHPRRTIALDELLELEEIVGADSGDENDDLEDDDQENLEDDHEDEDDDEDDEPTIESLQEELSVAKRARNRADRKARKLARDLAQAEQERDALKSGGQKELADAQDKIQELEATIESLQGQDAVQLVRDEFRDSTKFQWHNSRTAFALLDIDDIDVEDGKVDSESLDEAIDKLAKDHPYLVKTADKQDDEDEEERQPRRSGSNSSRSRKSARDKQRASLTKKFNLAGRI